MTVTQTNIDGLLVIEPYVFPDERGYFFESYSLEKYQNSNVDFNFVQDNISKSKKGTIRGLHYQVGKNAQGKLCQVIVGNALDVAVDIRFNSPTFGKHFSVELSEQNHKQLWIPPGFAHGFAVLSDEVVFHYKCTAYYSRPDERSIRFNDPELNIDWKTGNHILSEKDLVGKFFKEIDRDFFY